MDHESDASGLHTLIAAVLPKKAVFVLEELASKHGISTKRELLRVLGDPALAKKIPHRWRVRIDNVLKNPTVPSTVLQRADLLTSERDFGGVMMVGWKPREGVVLLVIQGDLTACKADTVVNAANSQLSHGGGLAKAIVRKGGVSIQKESDKWIQANRTLHVGAAMSTTSGKLPCKRIIHTVGPKIGRKRGPTDEEASQLRQAVSSVLAECCRLELASVAIPGISTGSYHYPVDLGAAEIVSECVRFCRLHPTTTLQQIAFMNNDEPTVLSFVKALEEAALKDETALSTQEQQPPSHRSG